MNGPDDTAAHLFLVRPDGATRPVDNTYEAIKEALDHVNIDIVGMSRAPCAAIIDDDGMLNGQPLNVPASILLGFALYGPAVLVAPHPDAEGETVPPTNRTVTVATQLGQVWALVREDAARKGQSLDVRADPNTIPPPQIIGFDNPDDFLRHLFGDGVVLIEVVDDEEEDPR